ncbi:MAG TPA: hypothetical protein VFV67_01375 [Actinophytocola sp.]|uniref:hypothetical protein n=1 Tax=Actinophytocola sp. TaxID=1872138 RepID=UPI002DB583E7|nr:hypothetical protein [Actinophytocola sp.]HEU5469275.1 hypothetical protein [Actinophytocola sp.]
MNGREDDGVFGVRGWLDRWRRARRLAKRRRERDRMRRSGRGRRERFSDWDAISRYADPFE